MITMEGKILGQEHLDPIYVNVNEIGQKILSLDDVVDEGIRKESIERIKQGIKNFGGAKKFISYINKNSDKHPALLEARERIKKYFIENDFGI